ncbi:MAG: NO-inducible flavohemoprotein [Janthinobacterium lividum]
MLTETQHDIIRATVPVLRTHGESITRVFYASMFDAHPELYDIFNPVNQVNGRQQRSLAGSVLAYAANIDRLDALGGMVERITHKHGVLEVQKEHYPIVGHHLLGAIKSVLGDAATPAILEAWAAAYGQLADILHGKEAEIYAAEANTPGGWNGFLPFRLEQRSPKGAEITAFTLRPEDGRALPPFLPGQYVSVKAQPPGYPHQQIRQYSLTHAPNGQFYRIAVRREDAGAADVPAGLMSSYLHDTLQEGGTLLVHMPLGDLVLDDSTRPVVLLSGGSGITPVLAMLDHLSSLAGGTRRVVFVHAARNLHVMGFEDEIAAMAKRRDGIEVVLVLEQDDGSAALPGERITGRISAELLRRYLPDDAEIYYCGPPGFMVAAETALDELLVPAPRRHSETFAPDLSFGDGIDHARPRAVSVK